MKPDKIDKPNMIVMNQTNNKNDKQRSFLMIKIGQKIIFFTLFLSLFSCSRNKETRGYEYVGDMSKSVAYETYSGSNVFNDGKSALQPVKGTIPREMVPYTYENDDAGLKKAGLELKNPLEAKAEFLVEGKELYDIFCLNCHGENGDGKGFLFTSEKFPIEPNSLIDEKTQNRPDGEIYHVIVHGGAAMGSFASQIKPMNRWKIILHIRNGFKKVIDN